MKSDYYCFLDRQKLPESDQSEQSEAYQEAGLKETGNYKITIKCNVCTSFYRKLRNIFSNVCRFSFRSGVETVLQPKETKTM